jgi:plastocyanin
MARLALLAVLAALAVALLVIGPAGAATFMVVASGTSFVPSTVTVAPGDTVEWMGVTGLHTVTSSSSNWQMRSAADTSFTFAAPGNYDYFCEVHGTAMSGRVVVGGAGAETATSTATATSTPVTTSTPASPTATATLGPGRASGTLVALLTGAGENPPVTTSGTGSVTLTLDTEGGVVTGTWNATGLSSNLIAAHIHRGARGTNGGIVVPFATPPSGGGSYSTTSSGVDDGLIREILANPAGFYVNVHTANNAGGEIRGQLSAPVGCGTGTLGALLLPSNEVPPRTAGATGEVTLTFDRAGGTITGTWNVVGPSGNIVAAHIHQNAAGANGPVVVPFNPLPTGGGRFSTTTTGVAPELIANILANPSAFYVNVHTDLNPSGETRGQLGCVAAGRKVFLPLIARLFGLND